MHGRHGNNDCELLGDIYSYLLQAALGFAAIGALWIKRLKEHPRRPVRMWLADVSKQVCGAGTGHVFNLLFSAQLTTAGESSCVYYLPNFLIDMVVGITLCFIALQTLETMLLSRGYYELGRTGHYGDNPFRPEFRTWFMQTLLWWSIVVGTKFITLYALVIPFQTSLYNFGDWVLGPVVDKPHLELVIVMVALPLVGNVVAFIVQDVFLKDKKPLPEKVDDSKVDQSQFYSAEYQELTDESVGVFSSRGRGDAETRGGWAAAEVQHPSSRVQTGSYVAAGDL
jgi:hypothetical protein